jgi:hypothetical protein
MFSSSLSAFSRARRSLAALAVLVLAGLTPVVSSGSVGPAGATESVPRGYWMVASDGGVFAYGGAKFLGSTGAVKLNMPIVGMAPTPSGQGYWLVASDGGIFTFGDAGFFGSTGDVKLNKPIVGMTATRSGQGYWLVASDGGIFTFGDAKFFGSTGHVKLNKPITGMTPSATGKGYRMVATDGGIFSFGDAPFYGSAGDTPLAKPISGMAPTPSGLGYWMIGTDGKVFNYGDAPALGSASALNSLAAMASTPTGAGYWAVGTDGSLATFGDATDLGHPAGKLTRPIVGMAALPATAATTSTGGAGGTDGGSGPVDGQDTDPGTITPPAPVTDLNKFYGSHAIDGSIGTRPQLIQDPSHPFREMCSPWDSCLSNITADTANYAEEVRAFARVGNRLFVGGFIHGLLDPTVNDDKAGKGTDIHDEINYLVELDATTGKLASDLTFTHNAAPDLTVEWIEASPDGKYLYISGRFTRAGGGRAPQFAALELTGPRAGLLAEGWDPSTPAGGSVHSITRAGDRLFLGGAFKEVDGKTQYQKVAAVNAQTGKLIEGWTAPPFAGSYVDRAGTPSDADQGTVNSVAVIGRYLVVGGEFLHAGPDAPTWPLSKYDPHGGLTVLNLSDGQQADWRPRNDRPAFQIAVSPDKTFVCAAVGGQGGAVTCLRPGEEWPIWNTGIKPEWDGISEHSKLDRHLAHVDGDALGITVTDQRVYLGGHFDVGEPDPDALCIHSVPSQCFPGAVHASDDATPNRHLIAFKLDGSIDPDFTPQTDTPEGVTTILAGPDALYVGGNLKNTMDVHPAVAAGCWPCQKKGGVPTFFHPGIALFPAVP